MTGDARRGFALPLVLFGVALASLSLFALLQSGEGGVAQARADSARVAADIAAETAAARVAHLLVSEPLGVRAIEVTRAAQRSRLRGAGTAMAASPVFLDGRPYTLGSGAGPALRVTVRIQDEAGLLNLNGSDGAAVARLLALSGVSRVSWDGLAARLLDFTDSDDLRRPGGADGVMYRAAGLARPRNRSLDAPSQALGAMGWREALSDGRAAPFLEHTATLPRTAWLNPNTATPRVLQAAFDIDASAAARILAAREKQSLLSISDVIALSGSDRSDMYVRATPARTMRLTVTVESGASQESYVYVSRLAIAQQTADGPLSLTRLETPVRALSRERTRNQRDDRAVVLPVSVHMSAPRNR